MTLSATIHVLKESKHLRALHVAMRRAEASQSDFDGCATRGLRGLLDESLAQLPRRPRNGRTPLSVVSLVRDTEGENFSLLESIRDLPTGKILIQSDKDSELPSFHSAYLPQDIATGCVLLLTSRLTTGTSAAIAVDVLVNSGVPVENIVLANILAAQTALDRLATRHPNLTIVTASIEPGMNNNVSMIPKFGAFEPALWAA